MSRFLQFPLFRERLFAAFCFLPVLLALFSVPVVYAEDHITSLVQNGAFMLKTPAATHSYNSDTKFVPASTAKLLTAYAALQILGDKYRFTTSLYLTEDGDLYIEGGGDPFLTSEVITHLATQLKAQGINTIHNLVLDTSNYNTPEQPAGSLNSANPYDTRNGALVVNFNSLSFIKTAKKIVSAEKQTPTIPLIQEIGQKLPNGKHRVNVWAFSHQEDISLRYTKELFTAIFARENITIQGNVVSDTKRPEQAPVILYRSEKNLIEMLQLCLKYSSNYIANQIFLEIGKQQYGAPATWEKGRKAMEVFIQKHFTGIPPEIVGGSGLSRENRLSANQLVTILERLAPRAEEIMPLKNGIMVKSGTLTGVYCYAGYFKSFTKLYPFAILLNQHNNSRDTLLELLRHQFSIDIDISNENPAPSQPTS